nr:uncharacterized protein LOC107410322 isoform X3 [Ziziphus jujuba var. spinosa]
MESLGFHLPQFSEDLVWLPCWLQQHQLEPLNECINETLDHSKSTSEDFALSQGNISCREDSLFSATKEGRHNGCHLFLSGEDNSPISFASSCGNVLQFRLHLSSDGYMQYSETQSLASNAYEAILNSNRVLSAEKLETSDAFREKTLSKMNNEDCGVNILPLNFIPEPVGKSVTQSPSNHKDSTWHYRERFSLKYLKGANINTAVELSTAASEALVIHEIMKSDSEALEAADVLEVALRVKQARLQCLDDAIYCSSEETDKNDSLSDLDDSTMADAFEDVGLPFSVYDRCIGSSSISRVNETPVSQNHHEYENNFSNLKLSVQQINFDNVATEKQLEEDFNLDVVCRKDSASESLKQKIVSGSPVLFSTTSNMAIYNDPPATKSPHVMQKTVDFTRVNITSCQPQTNEDSCLHPSNLQNSDRETYLVERFRSRWLGGWAAVVADDTAKLKQNTHRSVPKAFAAETSFLTESADVVPDENSFVHTRETQVHGESQSNIPFEGLHDEAVEVILHSQDVVRSSNLSLVDPLCSVVPCSIPSENVSCTIPQNLNYMETDSRKCCSPATELEMENSPRSTTANTEFQGPVRRRFTSLKTYSMLVPEHVATINGGSLYHNQSFLSDFKWEQLSFNKNMGCIRSCDKRTCKDTQHCSSMSKYTAGIHNEENCDNLENGITVERIKNQKKSDHETSGEGSEFLEKEQPPILNSRMCCCLQACIPSLYNSIGEKHPKEASIPENVLKLQKNQKLTKIHSDCESSHDGCIPSLNNFIEDKHPKEASMPENVLKLQKNHKLRKRQSNCEGSHDGHVPAEKRARFTEADTQIKQNKILQKLDSSKTNFVGPTGRTSKKLKYSEKWLNHRSHKKSLRNCCFKIGKRLIFQGIEFLLTGFSSEKEKDIEEQIRKHGGIILSDIPSPNSKGKRCSRSSLYQLPVILCLKKLQTTKFLYGCSVNAFILKVDWVTESIRAGYVLLPEKYMILSSRDAQATSIVESVHHKNNNYIFDRVGIVLHGKPNFCTKLAIIIKHGGGQVFKALHWLVNRLDKEKISLGVIVAEDENRASRHLRQCALEWKIPMMPTSWIIKSLYLGKLLPCVDEGPFSSLKGPKKGKLLPVSTEMSEEI